MRPLRRRDLALAALLAAIFGAGPAVGDVGGCNEPARPLDEGVFSRARRSVDCRRCVECGLATARCQAACDATQPWDVAFPPNCAPLRRDGEVCLDALLAASCADYARYVSDDERVVPGECAFCRGEAGP